MDIKKIILEELNKLIGENVQLADKVYFKPGLLSPKVREIIVSDRLTGGDVWTKLVTDIYYAELQQSLKTGEWSVHGLGGEKGEYKEKDVYTTKNDVMHIDAWRKIKDMYLQLKSYNKNVFPIKGLNPNGVEDIWSLISALKQRAKILEGIKKLPSIAIRNMKADIREPRDGTEMNDYRHSLEYFLAHYSQLDNRSEELKRFVEKKMFKSGVNIEQLVDFAEEKENLLGGAKFDKDVVRNLSDEHQELDIVYEKGNIMVVEVSGPYGIKEIGCNSLWCFTYGEGYSRNWSEYSYNDTVYVIIDFEETPEDAGFMHVVIKPIVFFPSEEDGEEINDNKVFDMTNQDIIGPLNFLDNTIGAEKAEELLHFYVEPEEEEPDEEKEKEYADPNQLALFEVRKIVSNEIKSIIKEASNISYTGVFLDDYEEKKFLREISSEMKKRGIEIPEDWKYPKNYHMTITLGELPLGVKVRGDIGEPVGLTVHSIGVSDNAIAAGVSGYFSKNDIQHITIAFKEKAVDSNYIKNWTPLDTPFTVQGTIREFEKRNLNENYHSISTLRSREIPEESRLKIGNKPFLATDFDIIQTFRNDVVNFKSVTKDEAERAKSPNMTKWKNQDMKEASERSGEVAIHQKERFIGENRDSEVIGFIKERFEIENINKKGDGDIEADIVDFGTPYYDVLFELMDFNNKYGTSYEIKGELKIKEGNNFQEVHRISINRKNSELHWDKLNQRLMDKSILEESEEIKYPIQDPPKFCFRGKGGKSNYKDEIFNGSLFWVSPKEFLNLTKPLKKSDASEDKIQDLMNHILEGNLLDPANLYINKGKVQIHDGRHRAIASMRLGIEQIPVIVVDSDKIRHTNFDFIPEWKKSGKGELEEYGDQMFQGGARNPHPGIPAEFPNEDEFNDFGYIVQ